MVIVYYQVDPYMNEQIYSENKLVMRLDLTIYTVDGVLVVLSSNPLTYNAMFVHHLVNKSGNTYFN